MKDASNERYGSEEYSGTERFIEYLKDTLPRLESSTEEAVKAAYDIFGTYTMDYKLLGQDKKIEEIATIAGELEINPQNAADLQKELIEKISKLNKTP